MINRKLVGFAALAALMGATAAEAFPPLPNLVNLDFDQTAKPPKGEFSTVKPVGWTGGTGLIFIDSTASFAESAAGPVYLTTYGNPHGYVTGNYVEADGNPDYESGFNYTVTGLTVGQTYTLSFYQGASTQTGYGKFNGVPSETTNQWIVALGKEGLKKESGGVPDPKFGATDKYYDPDAGASIAASQLMIVPYQGTVGWDFVSVDLTADATTDLLSFLAWGDNGSTVNLPPIAFLAGVDSPPGLDAPEPATWAMLGMGLFGVAGLLRSRRSKRAVGVAA